MRVVLFVVAAFFLCASPGFSQEERNAARKVEIAWPQYGYLHLGGTGFVSGGFDVAVTATDSVAIVGELRSAISSGFDTALISYRGGVRFRKRSGGRITMFVQGLAGGTSGVDAFGFTGSGFSFGAGGGLDVGLKKWLGVRVIQADYEMTRAGGSTLNGVRIGAGLVFRLGRRN